jgi:AcrR family transcriptional regulator
MINPPKTKNAANQFAKDCMVTALIQLLKSKKLSEITISELTKKAGVSRMTFYRNYNAKEDIFIQHINEIFTVYRKECDKTVCQSEFYDMPNLLHCFHYFYIHKEFINTLLLSGMGHLFLSELSAYVISVWYHSGCSINRYYTLQAFSGSLYNVYLTWSASGSDISDTVMAEMIHNIYAK